MMAAPGSINGVLMTARGLALFKAVLDGATSYDAELVACCDTDWVGLGHHHPVAREALINWVFWRGWRAKWSTGEPFKPIFRSS